VSFDEEEEEEEKCYRTRIEMVINSLRLLRLQVEQPKILLLRSCVDLSCAAQTLAVGIDQELGLSGRGNHVVSITLDPWLSVHPGKHLPEELVGVAFSDAKLGDPDGLVESRVEFLEVVLEVLGFVPSVVVGHDKVNLAVGAAGDEVLEPLYAFAWLVAVGDGG